MSGRNATFQHKSELVAEADIMMNKLNHRYLRHASQNKYVSKISSVCLDFYPSKFTLRNIELVFQLNPKYLCMYENFIPIQFMNSRKLMM